MTNAQPGHASTGPGAIPTRRFGRTAVAMPVLSLGGMRFQQSWKDLEPNAIEASSQSNLRRLLEKAIGAGLHHIETARHYGSSERQLAPLLKELPDPRRILQSKVPPNPDPAAFEAELKLSFSRLGLDPGRDRLDLLAIHGVNSAELLEQSLRPSGCLAVAERWREEGRIGAIGLSTHAPLPVILEAIGSDRFAYINLHWYYIQQQNQAAIEAATAHDMGVFVISPTDKGGHLHTPSERLSELCAPLHPIVFNDLFCLSAAGIHTISVGAARPEDLDLHLEAVALLPRAGELLPPILERLDAARRSALGEAWIANGQKGLPRWEDTPGEINLPVLLWLHDLLEAFELESFCRARYGLLGHGGHWFPGANADALDGEVEEAALLAVLGASPWADQIPGLLRRLREQVGGQAVRRLQET
jgi:predicted aldo/keto reductase-like oxidoreductase